YSSPLDLPMVLLQWVLIMTLWVAGGVFMGGAWYRHPLYGGLAIVIGILVVGISGVVIGSGDGPLEWAYRQMFTGDRPGAMVAIIAHLALIAILLGLTWAAFKDAPIHNRTK